MKRLAVLLALSLCLAGLPALARADTISAGRLHDIPLVAPEVPDSLVIYLSDRAGWTKSDDAIVEAMRQAGSIVLSVDLKSYAARLDADDGQCLYVVGEITDLAQKALRQLDISTYLPPIVAGSGEGATFAYAALADAPDNTLGGAVAIGFQNRLGLRLPFCPGATAKPFTGGGFSYAFDSAMPATAYLLAPQDAVAGLTAEATEAGITVQSLEPGREAGQAADVVQALVDTLTPPGDLPVVDLAPAGTPKALALFVSGDGGWRDLDETIGDWMSGQGIHVLGLDALHYFWSERPPEQFAADISALIKDADPTGKLPVMLIGYSFGADTLPFAWPYLDEKLKARIHMIGLLAPSRSTDFQVSVTGWLGVGEGAHATAPAIAALPLDRVVCVYGEDEDDNACPDKALDAATRIMTTGGHHFDGNYEELGGKLLRAFFGYKPKA